MVLVRYLFRPTLLIREEKRKHMAARKKTRKAAPEKSKAGRKKEIKRFEMEIWTEQAGNGPVAENEIAFVVRTSGGTPLNPTDTGKIHRLLQHELRALGHKLKRKGQELDPVKEEAPPEPPPADDPAPPEEAQGDEDAPENAPAASPADPDDPDAHNTPEADSALADSAELTPQ